MPQPQEYKDRAVQVRRSARAHLLELRQQRIAKRHRSAPTSVQTPEEADIDDIADLDIIEASLLDDVSSPADNMDADALEEDVSAQKDLLQEKVDSDGFSVEDVAVSEMTEEAVHHPEGNEKATLDSESSVSPSADLGNSDDCDLFELPGAGPGLVWMLNQCGITSLADMASADASALSIELGVVGQILDVEKWIDFAKPSSGGQRLT